MMMKWRVLLPAFLLLACSLLTACGKGNPVGAPEKGSEAAILSTHGHEEYQQSSLYAHFRYTDDGCFMLKGCEAAADNATGSLLCFAEEGGSEFAPLCGKSGCLHNSADCDASISGTTFGLYDEKLYYLADAQEVCCMELDGTAHRVVTSIPHIEEGLYNYCFDNEYMYYYIYKDSGELELSRIRLAQGSEPEHYTTEGIGYIRFITPTDGAVFADALGADGRRGLYYCTPGAATRLPIEDLDSIMGIDYSSDKVRYFVGGTDNRCGFYECEPSSGRTELIKEYDLTLPFGVAVYDNEFIYIEETVPTLEEYNNSNIIPRFYVFDKNYELLCANAIPYERNRGYCSFFAATAGQILFSTEVWPENVEYYIDKAEISADMTWHEAASEGASDGE